MKKTLFLVAVLFCTLLPAHSQIITCSVKPGTYSKIQPCWGDMFVVTRGSEVGVIKGDGSIIVPVNASRVTGFYDGLALVLKSDRGQEKILGFLSTDGSYTKVDGTYYTIPYQEFFSSGLLTVVSQGGRAGYMNDKGVVVKDFNESFVSPFSEGYAVVGVNRNYTLIDKNFNAQNIMLGTVSEIYGGSNVYKAEAVVWDGNGKYYSYDVGSGQCRKIKKPKSLDYDYMYCFSSLTGRSGSVAYDTPQRPSLSLIVSGKGGLYGYSRNNKIILPYQFEDAGNFYGKYAIASVDGKPTILQMHDVDDGFVVKVNSNTIAYSKNLQKNLPHAFEVKAPALLKSKELSINVTDDSGIQLQTTQKHGVHSFLSDAEGESKTFTLTIESEGMKLWQGALTYKYSMKEEPKIVPDPVKMTPPVSTPTKPLAVVLKMANTKADKNYRCYVHATVSNPNSVPMSATVSFSGSKLLTASSQKVTVPAHGFKTVSTYFTVKKAASGQSVTVSTSAGGHASLSGLQLIPD